VRQAFRMAWNESHLRSVLSSVATCFIRFGNDTETGGDLDPELMAVVARVSKDYWWKLRAVSKRVWAEEGCDYLEIGHIRLLKLKSATKATRSPHTFVRDVLLARDNSALTFFILADRPLLQSEIASESHSPRGSRPLVLSCTGSLWPQLISWKRSQQTREIFLVLPDCCYRLEPGSSGYYMQCIPLCPPSRNVPSCDLSLKRSPPLCLQFVDMPSICYLWCEPLQCRSDYWLTMGPVIGDVGVDSARILVQVRPYINSMRRQGCEHALRLIGISIVVCPYRFHMSWSSLACFLPSGQDIR